MSKAYLLLLTLLLIGFVHSAEDFSIAANTQLISCFGSSLSFPVVISNTGSIPSSYGVALGGSAAEYARVEPTQFSLSAGESTQLAGLLEIPTKGAYDLIMAVRDSSAVEEQIRMQILSQQCTNNLLVAHNINQTACPCLPMTYEFTVTNTGSTIESYTFGLDKFSEYVTISANPLILAPSEVGEVSLTFNLDCSIYGNEIVEFYSNAQTSGVRTAVPLLLNINACYDYTLASGQLLENNENKISASFVESSEEYTICSGDNKSIPIQIDNQAYIGNNYFTSLSGPSFGSLYTDVVSLNAFEAGRSYLDLSPGADDLGEYNFVVTSTSQRGDNIVQKVIDVTVEDCHGLLVEVEQDTSVCNCLKSPLSVTVENTGNFDETVDVSITGPEFATLLSNSSVVASKETEQFVIEVEPSCSVSGTFPVEVTASIDSLASDSDIFTLEVLDVDLCYALDITSDRRIHVGQEEKSVVVTLQHTGTSAGQYLVSFEGPEWISVDRSLVDLEPTEGASVGLNIDSTNVSDGYYDGLIKLQVENVIYQRALTVVVSSSAGVSGNIGFFLGYYRFWIFTGIGLLVLLIILFIYAREKYRVFMIRRLIKNSAHKKVNGKKSKKRVSKWPYIISILICSLIIIALLIVFRTVLMSLLSVVWKFIMAYLLYIIIGFVLLVVILYFLGRSEK